MIIDQLPSSASRAEEQDRHITSGDRAMILHTQRLSTEDGPGIRTTVFFKGCPLRCAWCHNPESISPLPQVHWLEVRCIGCGICLKTCTTGSLKKTEGGLVRDRSTCKACGKCADECPAGAQEMLGRQVPLEHLLSELLKDKVYYEKSGGGVTLSGGEPLMQPELSANLLRRLKENGISTAVDTCGLCSRATLEEILPLTDLILYDIKEIDPVLHKEFTGRDNQRILENLLLVRDYVTAHRETMLWIRTPLIPGATANPETLERIGKFIHENIEEVVQRWELCAFNNLCRDKYSRLGLEWEYASAPLLGKQELLDLEQAAKRSGPNPAIIFATGATRIETGGQR
jgi:pyruvate formate lyase activating enzyme